MKERTNGKFSKNNCFDTLFLSESEHICFSLRVEVCGDCISNFNWKEFRNVQFLQSFYEFRNKGWGQDHFPLQSWPTKGLLGPRLNFK